MPPSSDFGRVLIVTSPGATPGSFGPAGGVVVVNSPSGGGVVLLTIYGEPNPESDFTVEVVRVDGFADPASSAAPADEPIREQRKVPCEVVLHIERDGDRLLSAGDWIGNRELRRRIEGFSVRSFEQLSASDIEYQAFGPNGAETRWVTAGRLCGSRGRGLPMTGFAVRVLPHLRDRYETVYEGFFFESGVVGPMRNGEPCLPTTPNDPLGAMRLRIIDHQNA